MPIQIATNWHNASHPFHDHRITFPCLDSVAIRHTMMMDPCARHSTRSLVSFDVASQFNEVVLVLSSIGANRISIVDGGERDADGHCNLHCLYDRRCTSSEFETEETLLHCSSAYSDHHTTLTRIMIQLSVYNLIMIESILRRIKEFNKSRCTPLLIASSSL